MFSFFFLFRMMCCVWKGWFRISSRKMLPVCLCLLWLLNFLYGFYVVVIVPVWDITDGIGSWQQKQHFLFVCFGFFCAVYLFWPHLCPLKCKHVQCDLKSGGPHWKIGPKDWHGSPWGTDTAVIQGLTVSQTLLPSRGCVRLSDCP